MSPMERKNMIKYIEMMRRMDCNKLLTLPDADIEHIYETTYFQEENAE